VAMTMSCGALNILTGAAAAARAHSDNLKRVPSVAETTAFNPAAASRRVGNSTRSRIKEARSPEASPQTSLLNDRSSST
jgi:hypothetical protein